MRKFITLALCAAAVGSVCAQKQNVESAKKLAGKVDKIAEARALINEAMQNSETANQPLTYFVAGKIEYDAYDADNVKSQTVANAKVDSVAMGRELINGYHNMLKALPLDSLPDEKGKIKPKYSKDIAKVFNSHLNDYFNSGAYFFNEKMFYPEAYESFYIFGEIPTLDVMKAAPVTVDPVFPPLAYFNAGLAAYSANEVAKAAEAFRKSRLAGSDDPNAYIYEIASLQTLMQRDSTMTDACNAAIFETAKAGYDKFGAEQPLFINNMLNYLISAGRGDEGLAMLNEEIAKHPESGMLYGLRAYAYDRNGNNDASEADYRKAAAMSNVDFETLRFAAMKLYRLGTEKLNAIEGRGAEQEAARLAIKKDYFEEAKAICEKALAEKPGDADILNVLDNVNYALETYF